MSDISFRRYAPEDAGAIAAIFNARYGGFVGPIEVTPESWHEMYRKGWWNCPSLEADPDCVQVADRSGEVVGYVAFACDPSRRPGEGVVQELAVAAPLAGTGLEERLLAHAESIMASRGAERIAMHCSDGDGPLWRLLDEAGYSALSHDFSVFMLAVVDLPGLLERLAPRLAERVERFSGPRPGSVTVSDPKHSATVEFEGGSASAREGGGGECSFEMTSDSLVGLVTGTVSAEAAYLDGSLKCAEAGPAGARAVELLGELFPRMPHAMLRAHSW